MVVKVGLGLPVSSSDVPAKLSVMPTPVSATDPVLVFDNVTRTRDAAPALIVVGRNSLFNVNSDVARVSVAVLVVWVAIAFSPEGWPLSMAVAAPAFTTFAADPMLAGATTETVTPQLIAGAPAGAVGAPMAPPDRLIELDPGTAVTVPPHSFTILGTAAMVWLAGNGSVKAMLDVLDPARLTRVICIRNRVIPPAPTVDGV